MIMSAVAIAAAVIVASSLVALAFSWAGRGHFALGLAGCDAPAEMKDAVVKV